MKRETPISAAKRGPQIIKLLNTHGPLNAAAIQSLLNPPIERRRLNDAIARLVRKGIVVRRFQNLFQQSHDQYYQLSARKECQDEIGDVIGMDPNIFRVPRVRNQDLFHSIGCAHLAESLVKAFPGAEVVREFHIMDHRVGRVTLLRDREGDDRVVPDMILSIPEDEKHREVNIAFEFERTRKAPARIAEKFRNYARGTRINGVVWMCEDHSIRSGLTRIWLRQDRERFISIHNRFDHFLLFSVNEKVLGTDDWMFNAKGAPIKLSHWIDVLRRKDLVPLRDEHFQAISEEPAHLG